MNQMCTRFHGAIISEKYTRSWYRMVKRCLSILCHTYIRERECWHFALRERHKENNSIDNGGIIQQLCDDVSRRILIEEKNILKNMYK